MTHLSEAILRNTKGAVLTLHDAYICGVLKNHVDFLVYDAAARPVSVDVLKSLIAAAGDKAFLVRVENSQAATVQGYLNLGVDGLIFPDIHFAAEAEKVVASCLYPPEGQRAFRAFDADPSVSLQALNDQITLIVEIAHPQAVAQIEELAEVVGVDGVLVSPTRLAIAMEKEGNVAHPEVQHAIQSVIRIAQSFEMPCGIEGNDVAGEWDVQFTLPLHDSELFRLAVHSQTDDYVEQVDDVIEDRGFSGLFAVRE